MRITRLIILDNDRELFNSPLYKKTLIWSKDNSCGKTTLIRFILYAMGFEVPPTKKIIIKNYNTKIELDNPKRIILRDGNTFTINCPDEGITKSFDLTNQMAEAHAFLFNINNLRIINNLLGTFYIDQEKGWTLLNRGKVISTKTSFNIEDFIIGLTSIDTSYYDSRIDKLEEEIKRYTAILNVVLLQEEGKQGYKEEIVITQLKCEQSNIQSSILELETQKRELEIILNNNEQLINIIESYNLMIRVPNTTSLIKVTKDNIADFGVNQFVLKSQINEIDILISKMKMQNEHVKNELEQYYGLFNIDDVSKQVISQIKSINLSQSRLENLINSLKKEKKNVEAKRNNIIKVNYKIEESISLNIKKFTQQLNVYDEYVSKDKNYLKTRNLKEYSGAIYHKITLCYRLAYYCAVRDYLGIKLPFIIDSPGSAEVKADGMAEMMKLVNDVVEEQIIVSSIYDKELNMFDSNKIVLDKGIFNDRENEIFKINE